MGKNYIFGFLAVLFFLMGLPFFIGWLHNNYVIFFTVQGAAFFQSWGTAIACLFIASRAACESQKSDVGGDGV